MYHMSASSFKIFFKKLCQKRPPIIRSLENLAQQLKLDFLKNFIFVKWELNLKTMLLKFNQLQLSLVRNYFKIIILKKITDAV